MLVLTSFWNVKVDEVHENRSNLHIFGCLLSCTKAKEHVKGVEKSSKDAAKIAEEMKV